MMRALAAALLIWSAAAAAAPTRVVSLNLCTDELVLLLAAPGQLASVSFLGADSHETALAPRARGLPTNNGRLDSVVALAPDLVFTGGGSDRYARELAARLGLRVVDVPPPSSIADIRHNIATVAAALGRDAAGAALIARFDTELGPVPGLAQSALLLGGGGTTAGANGVGAQLLRHAGLVQQDVPAGQVSLERLLADPPRVIVQTQYRSSQASLGQSWLQHPALKALPAATRIITVDGRPWTCMGPLVAPEIARLRTQLR
jgi:iron complex transport system substrate-binding protein